MTEQAETFRDAVYEALSIAPGQLPETAISAIHGRAATIREQQQRAEQAEAERDGAYRERAHLVALLAAMTEGAVIAPAPDVEDAGWQIAHLKIGGHQASWHISPRDADLFVHVEHVTVGDRRAQWDGHTTDEKYERIRQETYDRACTVPAPGARIVLNIQGDGDRFTEFVREYVRRSGDGR
ncbi:hypothetical protein [Streptomyces sp. NPDC088733]|uniref:hypothetical protein n=1 Tax=Streptomyces sp. NPDC088733 TaxID=3365880 RepID=UPI0037F2E5B9